MTDHISVFITRKQKIRVRISKVYETFEPETNSVEEVTVGGTKWKSGDYQEYEPRIRRKVKFILDNIERKMNKYL